MIGQKKKNIAKVKRRPVYWEPGQTYDDGDTICASLHTQDRGYQGCSSIGVTFDSLWVKLVLHDGCPA